VLAALKVTPDVVYTGNPAYPATWGLWEWLGASQLSAKGKLNSKVLEPRKLGAQAGVWHLLSLLQGVWGWRHLSMLHGEPRMAWLLGCI
jgi:hypothetical protein